MGCVRLLSKTGCRVENSRYKGHMRLPYKESTMSEDLHARAVELHTQAAYAHVAAEHEHSTGDHMSAKELDTKAYISSVEATKVSRSIAQKAQDPVHLLSEASKS
jgi:hypothetical protein